jgi:hypothetical protein
VVSSGKTRYKAKLRFGTPLFPLPPPRLQASAAMPPSMSTEEIAFLDALLSEMGASLANGPPERPPLPPAKRAHDVHNTPIQESQVTYKSPLKDTKDLLDGAEEWDWDDRLDDEADASETSVRGTLGTGTSLS